MARRTEKNRTTPIDHPVILDDLVERLLLVHNHIEMAVPAHKPLEEVLVDLQDVIDIINAYRKNEPPFDWHGIGASPHQE